MSNTTNDRLSKVKIASKSIDLSTLKSVERLEKVTLSTIKTSTNIDFSKEDYTYSITSNQDLEGKTLKLPKNCILKFSGNGKFSNGILIGNNTNIVADKKIFDNIQVKGTFNCIGKIKWFATGCELVETETGVCYFQKKKDESQELQNALDSDFRELEFDPVAYYLGSTIILHKEKKLILKGSTLKESLAQCQQMIKNTCFIFSDKDITLLKIQADECKDHQKTIIIDGGNFDVSLCDKYTSNCIEVVADNEEKIWGLYINTNIKGKFNNISGVGININPIENKEMAGNKAFITQIRINSNIQDFGTGIKAMNYMDESKGLYYNWVTDLVIDGAIIHCPLAIETNSDCDIKCMIQAGNYFDTKENDKALIKFTGVACSISSNIFDIYMGGGPWANRYVMEVTNPGAKVVPYGRFNTFLIEGRWLNTYFVKGVLYNNLTEQIYNKKA